MPTDEETEEVKRLLVRLQRYAQYKLQAGYGVRWKTPEDYTNDAVKNFIPIVRRNRIKAKGADLNAYLCKAIDNQMIDDAEKQTGYEPVANTDQMGTDLSKKDGRGSAEYIVNKISVRHLRESLPEEYKKIYPLLIEWHDGSSLREIAKKYNLGKDSVRKKIRELEMYIQSDFLRYNEQPP